MSGVQTPAAHVFKFCKKMKTTRKVKKMNIKTIKDIMNEMDAHAEPYTLEKTNNKTGKKESIHIVPLYGGNIQYPPYM